MLRTKHMARTQGVGATCSLAACAAYFSAKGGEKDVIGCAESRWGARNLRLTLSTARIIRTSI